MEFRSGSEFDDHSDWIVNSGKIRNGRFSWRSRFSLSCFCVGISCLCPFTYKTHRMQRGCSKRDQFFCLDRKGRALTNVYPFTDIFKKGNDLLTDYIKFGKKSSGINQQILEALLSFLSKVEGKIVNYM